MYKRTVLGDYPHYLPGTRPNSKLGNSPGWMLLSYGKPVSASSFLPAHPPSNAFDEDIKTWWSAADNKLGEWIQIDLERPKSLQAVQVNFGEEGIIGLNRTPDFTQKYLLEYSTDGKQWQTLANKRQNTVDIPPDYLELKKPLSVRYVRVTDFGTPGGGKFCSEGCDSLATEMERLWQAWINLL